MEEEAGGGTDVEETNTEGEAPPRLRVRGALSWSPGWREPQSHSYSSKKSAWTALCSLDRALQPGWPLVLSGLSPRPPCQ